MGIENEPEYAEYVKELHEATDDINLKVSMKTERKGKASIRDKIVSGRFVWVEAMAFMSVIQAMLIFTALIPASIVNVNGFMEFIGINYTIPVAVGTIMSVVSILGMFVFGIIAVRLGTFKRNAEIAHTMSPVSYLLWKQQKELMEMIIELKGE